MADGTVSFPHGSERSVCRSYLFVPGNRPDRFGKAMAAGADAIILDLEDAVAPGEKEAARATVSAFLAERSPGDCAVLVRINGIRSRVGLTDILQLSAIRNGSLDGLLLPKVETPHEVGLADSILGEAASPCSLGALIETGSGLENVMGIAAAQRLAFLMFGGADLSAELRVPLAWEPLAYARARLVHAASRFGLEAVDMPWIALADDTGYRDELKRSVSAGFTARAAIHPSQIDAIHASLEPTVEALAYAERVMDAFVRAGGGACQLDGRLVERPVVLSCQRILGIARRNQQRVSVPFGQN